jgi:hypothetical protein
MTLLELNFQAPKGAADNCLKCPKDVENACPYSAKKIYLDKLGDGDDIVDPRWPMSVVCDIEDHPRKFLSFQFI